MSRTKKPVAQNKKADLIAAPPIGELAADIRSLIEATRLRVAQTVNAELVLLYWLIGSRIRRDVLRERGRSTGKKLSLHCTVETINRRLRCWLQPTESLPYGPGCRGLAGPGAGNGSRAAPRLEPSQGNTLP